MKGAGAIKKACIFTIDLLYLKSRCGCSSMVECQLPKLNTGVRFPSPAPAQKFPPPFRFRLRRKLHSGGNFFSFGPDSPDSGPGRTRDAGCRHTVYPHKGQMQAAENASPLPACRGTRSISPRNRFFCRNVLLHFLFKTYIIETTTKKAGRERCYQHPPALCRRRTLSHTADIAAPVFHYTPFHAFSQGGNEAVRL